MKARYLKAFTDKPLMLFAFCDKVDISCDEGIKIIGQLIKDGKLKQGYGDKAKHLPMGWVKV